MKGSTVREHAARKKRTVPEERTRRTILRALIAALRTENCTRTEYQQARALRDQFAETEIELFAFDRAVEVWEKHNGRIATFKRSPQMLFDAAIVLLLRAVGFFGRVWRKVSST